jgi:uncharacterized protein DUF5674
MASARHPTREIGIVAPGSILVLRERISSDALARLVRETFGVMVKYVVDIEGEAIAIGGELHADAEAVLLESGSRSAGLWGANYYPGRGREACIEFTALINIRPARGNPGMEVLDPAIRQRIRALTFALIGEGEQLG